MQLGPKNFVRQHLKEYSCKTIIDLCCGTGDFAEACTKNTHYFGFDANEKFISYAKKKYGKDLNKKFSIENVLKSARIYKKKYDAVIFISSMHHFSDEELAIIFPKIKRLIGKIMIIADIIPNPPSFIQKLLVKLDRGTYVRSEEEKIKLIKKYFKIIKTEIIPSKLAVQFCILCSLYVKKEII